MKVKDIASREVYSVAPGTCLNEVASLMKRHGVGALPVCDGDSVVGMITDRDVVVGCIASGMDACTAQASHCMTSNPVCIAPDTDLEQAATVMSREQVRRLPVQDNGKLVGMLTLGDLAMALTDNAGLVASTLRAISSPARAAVCQ